MLMVENLNMMFRDMADSRKAGWRLRQTLQTEPRIVLLASATSRFVEIDHPGHALYDLFRTLTLRPLDTNECAVLWEAVSGRHHPPETIRSLEILTGGSPRLLAIVARFGGGLSFRELMADLLDLVDDHTEYFKSHLESLPAQERRVYLALADLWKPALTKEIADRARLETSKCSAQLTRLVERGAVQVAGGTVRRKQYYLSERLYNIYYLLRRNRRPDRLIEALIRFMASYYSPTELKDIGIRIAREAGSVEAEMRSLHHRAFARLIELPALAGYREELRAMAPADFAEVPSEVIAARALFGKAVTLWGRNQAEDAFAAFDELVNRFGESETPALLETVAMALVNKGVILGGLNRPEEELTAYDEVLRRFGESETPALLEPVANALVNKGVTLGGLNRPEEALAAYDEVVRRFGESENPGLLVLVAVALIVKGAALGGLKRPEEALAAYDEVVHRFGTSEDPALLEPLAKALVNKGVTLGTMNRPEEALAAYDEMVRRFGESENPGLLVLVAKALLFTGVTLGGLKRPEEALAIYDEVVRRFGEGENPVLLEQVAKALVNKGVTLGALNRPEEALAICDEVVRRFGEGENPVLLEQVAKALVNKGVTLGALNRPEEELAAHDEVVRRFGESESSDCRSWTELALIAKAAAELVLRQYGSAIETAGRVLAPRQTESQERRLWGHLVRARAILASGDPSACEQDIEAILAILPEIGSLPKVILNALVFFSATLGAQSGCASSSRRRRRWNFCCRSRRRWNGKWDLSPGWRGK